LKPGLNEFDPGNVFPGAVANAGKIPNDIKALGQTRDQNIQKERNGKMQPGSSQIPGGFLGFTDQVLKVSSRHIFPIFE
jgi:hypothetical protein